MARGFAYALYAVSALALVVGVGGGLLMEAIGTSYEKPHPGAPLRSLSVTREHEKVTSIRAVLDGTKVETVVNLRILEGFEPYMKPEALERRLGPPAGRWTVPRPKAPRFEGVFGSRASDALAPYYDRPDGRATLRPFPTPEQGLNWNPVAFPKDCTLEYLFPDPRLRTQLEAVLPEDGVASLAICRPEGWQVLVVSLNRHGCTDLERMAP